MRELIDRGLIRRSGKTRGRKIEVVEGRGEGR